MPRYSHPNQTKCKLCARIRPLEFHHLIPKKVHRRTFYRKNYSRDQLNIGNGKWRSFVVLEFKTGLAYKTFINEVETNQTAKADIKKLKNSEAFKELEEYVAEFTGA